MTVMGKKAGVIFDGLNTKEQSLVNGENCPSAV